MRRDLPAMVRAPRTPGSSRNLTQTSQSQLHQAQLPLRLSGHAYGAGQFPRVTAESRLAHVAGGRDGDRELAPNRRPSIS